MLGCLRRAAKRLRHRAEFAAQVYRLRGPLLDENTLGRIIRLLFAHRGSTATVSIAGADITVRAGTPDLEVAFDSLRDEFEILRFILPETFDGLIVDAGGYIGTAAIALHRLFPGSTVVSIEPSAGNLEILKSNVVSYPRIHAVQGALVGSRIKSVRVMDVGQKEWGYTTAQSHKDSQTAIVLGEAKALRLGDLVAEWGSIGILKLDIEGGELDVFEHADEALISVPQFSWSCTIGLCRDVRMPFGPSLGIESSSKMRERNFLPSVGCRKFANSFRWVLFCWSQQLD